MIQEAYCSDDVCKLLKEKGFKEPCTALNRLVIQDGEKPFMKVTHQKAMAWLREVHHLEIYPSHDSFQEHCNWWFSINKFTKGYSDCPYESDSIYFTYEDAVEAALKYCLENLI